MGKPNHGNRNTRDLGFGAGKGDAPRSKFDENWRAKFSEIHWPGVTGLIRDGNKLVKRYR